MRNLGSSCQFPLSLFARLYFFCVCLLLCLSCFSPSSLSGSINRSSFVANGAKIHTIIDPMKHDIFLTTGKSFDSLIAKSRQNGVSLLLHFDSSKADEETHDFINNIYNEVAKDLKNMIKIVAVDCAEWTVFCKQNLNPDLKPLQLVVYPPNPLPPYVYQGDRTKAALISSLTRLVPGGNVRTLTKASMDSFLTEDTAIPKVVLFSSKQKSPVMFNALSNAFADRVSFGFVAPGGDSASLMTRFKVKKTPACFIQSSGSSKQDMYNGPMQFSALHEWINVRSETFVRGGGFSDNDSNGGDSGPRPWLVEAIPEMTGPSHQDICFKHSHLCVIFIVNGRISEESLAMLEGLSGDFSPEDPTRGARFKFMWLDGSLQKKFVEMVSVDLSKTPSAAVVFNPHKRLRYISLPEGQVGSKESIVGLLEKILSGDARFTNVKGQKIPPFAIVDNAELPKKKDEL